VINKYNKYKDNGVEWAGKFPEHWDTLRLKEIVKKLEQGWSPNAANWPADRGEYGVLKLSAISGGKFIENENKELADHTSSGQLEVSLGALLITRSNTPSLVGECCPVTQIPYTNLIVPDLIFSITPSLRLISLAFLAYQMNSASFRWLKRVTARGLNDSMVKISQGTIKNWRLLIPPIPEQNAIVAYLDSKTAQIDHQIDLLQQKSTHYCKLKQSLIYETVTRGLDKSLPTKESGVAWIKKVPEQWMILRLKDIAYIKKGEVFDFEAEVGEIPYLNGGINPSGYSKKSNTPTNVIAVSEGGASSGYTQFMNSPFWCGAHCYAVFPRTKCKKYLYYCIKGYEHVLTELKTGSAMPNLKKSEISNFAIPITKSYEEQTAIANFLDAKTARIDCIVSALGNQIEILKNLRQKLINDLVTGKIKVLNEGLAV
jgi:type I restriction enzyme S subunit